jgi:DNA-binding transcriptional LysR family regulator
MEFERLSEFAAIAQSGSIKKAAQELGLSCATLSARLIKFEEQLGKPLFVRSRDGVSLTASGQLMLPNALEALAAYQRVLREIKETQKHYYSRLRIAVAGTNLPLYLGPFLDRLNLTYPDIRLELMDDTHWSIEDGLRSGNVDVYFAPAMADFAPEGLAKNTVVPSSQHVLLPRSHPLADRTMVSIRELDGERFILYPHTAEPAVRNFQLRNLEASGISFSVYESETSALFYKLLVPVGKGLLIRPTPMMDVPPNTVCLPLSGLPHPASLCFFYVANSTNQDILAFARDFPTFAKEAASHEHNSTI